MNRSWMTKPKKMIKKSRRLTAALLCFVMAVSLCTGLRIYDRTSSAAVVEKTFDDSNIQWGCTISDGKATNVYLHAFIGSSLDSVTIPASFTDSSGTYDVVSIGAKGKTTNIDSFFDDTVVNKLDANGVTVDASSATKHTSVNDDAF